ncbi:hypothetical protein AM493_00465 [Flavobacterium akiainvivens]|uniref:DUF1543 domain-containing protein n=2 Tax=Flavobacterium akiainvivens TaxID=1202724 RepID=A0A0M8M714_9FLAO|nr:DUF1543 domain-containing protein [Flavobacterium akiainvivens]KOS04683.1 hypothetical protein AM493_00465 [Flavobacterium akiainvivens]
MNSKPTLYMVVLGATPPGRLTEQHDIFFGIGTDIKALKPDMYAFWHNGGQLHIDSWRQVTKVGGYNINIVPKESFTPTDEKLFFLNLGGYKPADLEEYHYKMLVVAKTMAKAVKAAKQTAFYKHYNFKGAESHIDEKYALDVDDMHNVEDILPLHLKEQYRIAITPSDSLIEDELHAGYVKLGPFTGL